MFDLKRMIRLQEAGNVIGSMTVTGFENLKSHAWDEKDPEMQELMRRLEAYAKARTALDEFLGKYDSGL